MSGCSAVTPPMSQRSQVANSGSSPIDACQACAAPGRSRSSRPASARVAGGSVHHTAVVQGALGQVQRLLAEHLPREPAPEVGDDLVRDPTPSKFTSASSHQHVVTLVGDGDVGQLQAEVEYDGSSLTTTATLSARSSDSTR